MVRAIAHKKPNIRVPVVPKSRCAICLQNERSPYTSMKGLHHTTSTLYDLNVNQSWSLLIQLRNWSYF